MQEFDQQLHFYSRITLEGANELKTEYRSLLLIVSHWHSSYLSAVILSSRWTIA